MKRRIAYLDTFCPEHSGRFWKAAFEQYGEVQTYEVGGLKDVQKTIRGITDFRPDHIHFGGSTQSEKTFKFSDIQKLKDLARVTFFYGDGYYRPYFFELADIVDGIYVTNKNLCQRPNIYYTLCPAPKEMATKLDVEKDLDVTFIGNNYNRDRRRWVHRIYELLGNKLTVFGNGWKRRKINTQGPIPYERFSEICQRSRIVLGDPAGPICYYSDKKCGVGDPDKVHTSGYCRAYQCSKYTALEGYVSNRVPNILMSGAVCLMPYVKGLDVLTENVHFYMYRDWKDFCCKAQVEDKEMGSKVQRIMLNHYTFEAVAKRILDENSTSRAT